MLSRLFRKSSYLRTPSTSLYAEHNRLRSAEEFVSARDTICSESKKKKRAMSLFSIKSLINKLREEIDFIKDHKKKKLESMEELK